MINGTNLIEHGIEFLSLDLGGGYALHLRHIV